MIAGFFHQGSGLGNQLFRYVAVRTLAEDKGYEWRMEYKPDGSNKETGFKGKAFMNIDYWSDGAFGKYMPPKFWQEKKIVENDIDIRGYDPEFNFVEDNTIIEGEFQDERYWGHRLNDIREWLKVEPLEMPDDLCVIGFRGGEYSVYPDLFLPKEYWDTAIQMMRRHNPNMRFEVHTDDPVLAKQFFPAYHVVHNIGLNWRAVRYAKHLIIANSSFYILPALLNESVDKVIAPRYWARHNVGTWSLPQNFYRKFTYI